VLPLHDLVIKLAAARELCGGFMQITCGQVASRARECPKRFRGREGSNNG
jgi:hypothetical protein